MYSPVFNISKEKKGTKLFGGCLFICLFVLRGYRTTIRRAGKLIRQETIGNGTKREKGNDWKRNGKPE